jgi:hypothetical protein
MAAEHGNQEPVGQTAPGVAVGQLATVVPATAIALAKSNGIAIKNFLDTCIAAPWIKSVNESWRHDQPLTQCRAKRAVWDSANGPFTVWVGGHTKTAALWGSRSPHNSLATG